MVTVLHKDSLNEVFTEANLRQAWVNVERKDSAAGIDRVSVSEFGREYEANLREIQEQVLSHSYVPSPLVSFQKSKSISGWRELTIATVRDRVVGRCAADALNRRFNYTMAPQSYAYRPDKSALRAVAATQHSCRQSEYVLRLDIDSFFDSIDHQILVEQLRYEGVASDFIELLEKLVRQPRSTGYSLRYAERGIPQGSQLAPVLSNLYLTPFDNVLQKSGRKFIRYADDVVIFANSSSEAHETLNQCNYELGLLNLQANQNKTRIYQIDSGFVFLGFVFNRNSHVASREARSTLRQKLDRGAYADESAAEWRERREMIVRGWRNYFKPEKKEVDFAYGPSVARPERDMLPEDSEHEKSFEPEVESLVEDCTVADYDAAIKQVVVVDSGVSGRVRNLLSGPVELLSGAELNKLSSDIRRMLNSEEAIPSAAESEELLGVLAKVYRQLGMYGAANRCLEEAGISLEDDQTKQQPENKEDINFADSDIDGWLRLFGGVQVYHQYLDRMGRNGFRPYKGELQADDIRAHWEGGQTLSVSVYSSSSEVRYAVLDLDITRQHLDTLDKDGREKLRGELLDDARNLLCKARSAGIDGVIEDSCFKGYHLWFFFGAPQKAATVREFLSALCHVCGTAPKGTHRELFPGSDTSPADGVGNRMRLPLGVHRVTGQRSIFLTADGVTSAMGSEVPVALSLVSGQGLTQAIKTLREYGRPYRGGAAVAGRIENAFSCEGCESSSIYPESSDIDPAFEGSDSLMAVAKGCAVLRVLAARARQEQHLCHAERIILRGILMPAGPEGRQALHAILSSCRNYNQRTTEKYATTHQFKPIGCARIKEILGEFTDRVGCNCEFKPRKNNYAHPLRHINRAAGVAAQQAKSKTQAVLKSATTPIAKPSVGEYKVLSEEVSEGRDTLGLIAQYRSTRAKLLEAQRGLLGVIGGAESVETPVGRLKLAGADTEIMKWQLELV